MRVGRANKQSGLTQIPTEQVGEGNSHGRRLRHTILAGHSSK